MLAISGDKNMLLQNEINVCDKTNDAAKVNNFIFKN